MGTHSSVLWAASRQSHGRSTFVRALYLMALAITEPSPLIARTLSNSTRLTYNACWYVAAAITVGYLSETVHDGEWKAKSGGVLIVRV